MSQPAPEPSIEDLVRQVIDTALVNTRLGRAAFDLSPEGKAAVIDSTQRDDVLNALVAMCAALLQVVGNLGAEIDELRDRVAGLETEQ